MTELEKYINVPLFRVYIEEIDHIAREYGFNDISDIEDGMQHLALYGYEHVFDDRFKRYPRSVSELSSIYNELVSSSMRYYRNDSVDVNSLCWQELNNNRAMWKCIPWFTKNYPNTVIVKRNGNDIVKSGHNRIDFYSGNNDGRVISIKYNPRNRRYTYKKLDANNQEIFKFTPYDTTG